MCVYVKATERKVSPPHSWNDMIPPPQLPIFPLVFLGARPIKTQRESGAVTETVFYCNMVARLVAKSPRGDWIYKGFWEGSVEDSKSDRFDR